MSKHINKYRKPTQPKKNNSNISFVNLSTYTSPKIVEDKNKEWVGFGEDNNYFQYLIDRYNGSATNGAIINAMASMIFGRGLDATDSARKPEQYAMMISLLKKETLRRAIYDLKLTSQCALQIAYSKDKKKIVRVEHLPVETLRAEKCGENDKEVQAYYYHPNWADLKPSDKPKRIPAFGVSEVPQNIEILYVKPYKAGMYYYSTPDYQGGLQYAELEEEIANYHINNIQNGLAPSMLINFNNGVPTEEQRSLIEQNIQEKFSGSSNAGRFILAFNDSKELSASIEPVILSDAHEQYKFLSDESMRKVMVSHRIVSPMLVGIKDKTGLGNNAEELQTASLLMDNTVIRPMQVTILDELEKVLMYNGIELDIYFKTLQPLEFTDLTNAITDAEVEKETGIKKGDSEIIEEEQINTEE